VRVAMIKLAKETDLPRNHCDTFLPGQNVFHSPVR
jgi:hypothetical protein